MHGTPKDTTFLFSFMPRHDCKSIQLHVHVTTLMWFVYGTLLQNTTIKTCEIKTNALRDLRENRCIWLDLIYQQKQINAILQRWNSYSIGCRRLPQKERTLPWENHDQVFRQHSSMPISPFNGTEWMPLSGSSHHQEVQGLTECERICRGLLAVWHHRLHDPRIQHQDVMASSQGKKMSANFQVANKCANGWCESIDASSRLRLKLVVATCVMCSMLLTPSMSVHVFHALLTRYMKSARMLYLTPAILLVQNQISIYI